MFPQYVDYYYRTVFVDRKYKKYSKNVRFSITSDEFMSLPMIVPPLSEQKKIADFRAYKRKNQAFFQKRADLAAGSKCRICLPVYKKMQAVIDAGADQGGSENQSQGVNLSEDCRRHGKGKAYRK